MRKKLLIALVLLVSCTLAAGAWSPSLAQEFLISTPAGGDPCFDPDVAYGDGAYLVVWTRYGSIFASRVLPDGTVQDPGGIEVPGGGLPGLTGDGNARVSFDGTNFVETHWNQTLSLVCFTNYSQAIRASRISQAGVVLDTYPVELAGGCTENTGVGDPSISFDGATYLAVWREADFLTENFVMGRILTPALGTVTSLSIAPYLSAYEATRDTATAYGHGNHLAAWTDQRDGDDHKLFGARVSPAGTVLDPASIAIASPGTAEDNLPDVAASDSEYLVVWDRAGSVRGARVSPAGAVLDPDGFVIHTGTQATVASDGARYLVAWAEALSAPEIHGAFVGTDGTVGSSFLISAAGEPAAAPSAAFDGSRFLVVWQRTDAGDENIYGAFVNVPASSWELGARESIAASYGASTLERSRLENGLGMILLPLAVGLCWAVARRRGRR